LTPNIELTLRPPIAVIASQEAPETDFRHVVRYAPPDTLPLTVTSVFVAITALRVESVVGRTRTLTAQLAAQRDVAASAKPTPAGISVTSSRARTIGTANRLAEGMACRLGVRCGDVCGTPVMAQIGHRR